MEAETFWGRNLDLRAPFAIEMRQLPLTRTVGIAHKQLCRHRGFGGGKRDRSRRSRNGESVDRAAPPDDDDWQIPTLGTYAEERIGAVIATDEQDPLAVGGPRGRRDIPRRSVQGLGQTDALAAVRRLEIHEKVVTVLGNAHADVSDRASVG